MIVKHSQRWKLLQMVITQGSQLCLPPLGNPSAVLRTVALLLLNARLPWELHSLLGQQIVNGRLEHSALRSQQFPNVREALLVFKEIPASIWLFRIG